jgi:hypothetical protein
MRKAILFLMCGAAMNASGQTAGTGSLSGRILDAVTRQPFAGEHLLLVIPPKSYQAWSDANGNYSFPEVRPGLGMLYRPGENKDLINARDNVWIRVQDSDKLTEDFLLIRSGNRYRHGPRNR